MMKRVWRAAALGLAAVLSIGAGNPHPNWNAKVTVAQNGTHTLGNPDAPVKLTEFVSYTCPHCSNFQVESEAPMRLAYVQPGKVSVEVHHLLRDPVDLTVAMLTNCGDPKTFFRRHNVFMHDQKQWLSKMGGFSKGQMERWKNPDVPTRLRAIASDFDFYATMARFGMTRSQVDACLADKAMAKRLAAQTQQATDKGVNATPSFAINGVVLIATHDWETVQLQLDARVK